MDCRIYGEPCFIAAQGLISGVMLGGIYALIALGIVIVNKASGVFNFAHGFMMWFGALLFWELLQDKPVSPLLAFALSGVTLTMLSRGVQWPKHWSSQRFFAVVTVLWMAIGLMLSQQRYPIVRAAVGTAIGASMIGLLIERFTIRPLIGQPLFTQIMMTLAVAEVLKGFAQLFWGSLDRGLTLPLPFLTFGTDPLGRPKPRPPYRLDRFQEDLGGVPIIEWEPLIAAGVALAAFVLFMLFFRYTKVGLSMRATAEDQDLAQSTGIRVRRVLAMAWVIAGVMAAMAGILQGTSASRVTNSMPETAYQAFPAVLLGGLESVSGAIVGGLVIGISEQIGVTFFSEEVDPQLIPFLVLMVVLIIRPEGLFGQKRIERI